MSKTQKNIFYRCCYGYLISGMVILSFGAIMPSLILDSGMNFAAAGGLISFMAIGNLTASFVFPLLVSKAGLKKIIVFFTLSIPFVLLYFSAIPALSVMYVLVFLIGLSRGAITIINNQAVNQIIPNPVGHLNILHSSFAVGAFLSPFLTAALIRLGFNWKYILYLLAGLSLTSVCCYFTMDYAPLQKQAFGQKKSSDQIKKDNSFLKKPDFYVVAFILFFYLGVENCINGWFVTYLQGTGMMTSAYSQTLVSIIWLVIMAGRLLIAKMGSRLGRSKLIMIQTIAGALCFFLLISATNLSLVTIALIGFGFFLAGVYPTCVAEAGQFIVGSTFGMSVLTAISAAGGIITPQLVGLMADQTGILAAMGILAVNVVIMIGLGLINFFRAHKRSYRSRQHRNA